MGTCIVTPKENYPYLNTEKNVLSCDECNEYMAKRQTRNITKQEYRNKLKRNCNKIKSRATGYDISAKESFPKCTAYDTEYQGIIC